MQPFERGIMVWRERGDARPTSGQFWQVADSWSEGMPADDPALPRPARRASRFSMARARSSVR
ncbi:MAG: hypothetical protein M5U29_16355 [Anaerolineae bacterium]|nr:hypothetical protein [Anaerolineae bacterium]